MAEKKEPLFDQFPGISYDEWRAKVEADLKGADFNKKLVWRTNEGFNVQPIYRAEDIADLKPQIHSQVNIPMSVVRVPTMTGLPVRRFALLRLKRLMPQQSMSLARASPRLASR